MPIKKRVLSFDFDGCLFNDKYTKADEKDVILHNQGLLEKIKIENQAFDKVISTIGSNRQSKELDDNNHYAVGFYYKGSCFPAIKVVSDFLGSNLDCLLLADIFSDLTDGTAYQYALKSDYQGDHPQAYCDESKLAIVYSQIL